MSRRDFVRLAALGAAAAAARPWAAMAGPFVAGDFERLVPADKKLAPAWVESLADRGTPQWLKGEQLRFVGMPVGGLCAGQVYLGGDGRLWHWDVFNQPISTGDGHYAHPLAPASPLAQGFALRAAVAGNNLADKNLAGKSLTRALDATGFADVRFRGEYPIGRVEYRDPASPLGVTLEAFSPFVPLDADDSGLPATVLKFTLHNPGEQRVEAELAGWLENAVCLHSGTASPGARRNRVGQGAGGVTLVECSATPPPPGEELAKRPDVLFEDFEKPTYEGWTVAGTAFGEGPIEKAKMPAYQGDVGGEGKRVVNSHNARHGEDVRGGDAHTGRLTSRELIIDRRFIRFYIGGGRHAGKTCLNLLVGGKVVRTATGHNDNRMRREAWDVHDLEGKAARIEVVDEATGEWGNIGVDQIVFTDAPATEIPLDRQADFGTLALALLAAEPGVRAEDTALPALAVGEGAGALADAAFAAPPGALEASAPFPHKPVAAIRRKLSLDPGQSAAVTFVIAWHFPHLKLHAAAKGQGRSYATRFASASAVVAYLAEHLHRLEGQTRLWRDTWYDSTLPYWFLDRTFANTSILATSTSHRFADGRFYGWEGVGCCEGTCTHVWHYAHAPARLFPALERDLRQRTDFGLAFEPRTGVVRFRGEAGGLAIDGQAGVVLRSYREHQVSADATFLRANWPAIRKATECLIARDGDANGILEGSQHNTLDTNWFGPVAWLSGLYLAALRAAEEMAGECGDAPFAARCRSIFEAGTKRIVELLFNGEYFVNHPDPAHPEAINSGTGCEIDQVFGQSWAFQVGLGRVLPEGPTRSALRSLWRYNFTPDVGPYRQEHKPGRWYAMPGEAGLLMCSFPRADWDYAKAAGKGPEWAAGYFNECMNGFEYQAAGHMIWEGMVTEGLAVTRAVHDRYAAERRNPWNEVECGDHYARSMASYGVFLAACGFEYHGPRGHLGFAPRLTPEAFKAAFTVAEGFGTFRQKSEAEAKAQGKAEAAVKASGWRAAVEMKSGQLRLRTLALRPPPGKAPASVAVAVAGKALEAAAFTHQFTDGRLLVTLAAEVILHAGEVLEVTAA